jgi:protein CpxP
MQIQKWLSKGLFLTVLAAPLAALPAQAGKGGEGKGARMGGGGMGFFKELNLSEEQRAKLKELRENNKGDLKPKREALKKARDEFRSLMGSENATDAQIRSAFQKLQALRSEVATGSIDRMLAVRQVLTPEQRKKAHEMREKRGAGQGRMGNHQGADEDDVGDDEL